MSETPLTDLEHFADQLIENWPGAWFAPMNYSAISHVDQIKKTLGTGMDLYGGEQSAISSLIELLGREQFVAQLGDLVAMARIRSNATYVARQAKAAKKHGTIVSYDLNYRPSLWKANGGEAAAQKVNQELASYVDVMFGNEEDFIAALGISVGGAEPDFSGIDLQRHESVLKATAAKYPNMSVIAETLRHVHSASDNDWSAIAFADGKVHHSNSYPHLEILDRIGGGDSFASGFIYGMLEFGDPAIAINYGVAHGALAMTTPGDTSMATLKEVKNMVAGGNARVSR